MLDGYSGWSVWSARASFMDWEWRVTRAEELSELVSRSAPTVAGISLESENIAIIYDQDEGTFQFSMDEWMQAFDFELFGRSFQRSLVDAFDEIERKRPDVLEKATPKAFINEIQKMFEKTGALRTRN